MKPLYKAATNMLDVVDGKASFLLSYVDTPPAISGAVFTSVCISVETKICTGLDDGPGAYWSHFLKAKTFKDLLVPQATLLPNLSPFSGLQNIATGKTDSKRIWFLLYAFVSK